MNNINVDEINATVKVTPTGDRVLIVYDLAEKQTAGGILLATSTPTGKNAGTVLAVGDYEGIRVKPGDRVLFEKGMGSSFQKDYEARNHLGLKYTAHHDCVLVPYFDIIAILEG